MSAKAKHKELKRAVRDIEEKRNNDRSTGTWYDLRTLKKLKLKAKEKINETKQINYAFFSHLRKPSQKRPTKLQLSKYIQFPNI